MRLHPTLQNFLIYILIVLIRVHLAMQEDLSNNVILGDILKLEALLKVRQSDIRSNIKNLNDTMFEIKNRQDIIVQHFLNDSRNQELLDHLSFLNFKFSNAQYSLNRIESQVSYKRIFSEMKKIKENIVDGYVVPNNNLTRASNVTSANLQNREKCKMFTQGAVDNKEFYSPGYPGIYPNNTNCILKLRAPSGYVIRLDFRDYFALEHSESCQHDSLEVRDGGFEYSPLKGIYCGNNFPPIITSSNQELWLKFTSDENIEYRGFRAFYSFIVDPDQENTEVRRNNGGDCEFPENWWGEWFQQGIRSNITISRESISTQYETKKCIRKDKANRYLVKDQENHCYKCMIFSMKPPNVLQYQESFCESSHRGVCEMDSSYSLIYSMFRMNAEPVSCPFHGPLTFSYNKAGRGECKNPLSQVDSCTDDSRLMFHYQACTDVPGSEESEEELLCLTTWEEGSTHYLVGKVDHQYARNDEDRYRCFAFENSILGDGRTRTTWKMSQSGDASCMGLFSVYDGYKTMKLTKVSSGIKTCKFPSWLTNIQHWRSFDSSENYDFHNENTSLRISQNTDMPENSKTLGNSYKVLLCQEFVRTQNHHIQSEQSGDHDSDYATLIVHVTEGCLSGYQCIQIYRLHEHVIQVQSHGHLVRDLSEMECTHHNWNPNATNITTLVISPKNLH